MSPAATKAPPTMQMTDSIALKVVKLDDIYIDKFQRPADERWLKAREGKVDLAMLGTLIVSDRPRDGKLFSAIDGQHRHELMVRHGMDEWFAIVFTGLTIEDEAELFTRYQRERRNITPYQRFNAALVAGKPEAKAIDRIVKEEGFSLGQSETPGVIKAIVALERIYQEDPAQLRMVLGLIRDTWGRMPYAQNERMIKGIWFFVRDEPDLDHDRFVDRLSNVTPSTVASRADQLRQGRGLTGGLPKLVQEVIENEYRSRARKRAAA